MMRRAFIRRMAFVAMAGMLGVRLVEEVGAQVAIERELFHFTEVWSDASGEYFTADFVTWHPFPPGYPVGDFMEGRHLPCVLGRPVAVRGVS